LSIFVAVEWSIVLDKLRKEFKKRGSCRKSPSSNVIICSGLSLLIYFSKITPLRGKKMILLIV
jgi:hypothetical protein